MEEQDLWAKVKDIAQSEGRREDWVYILDLYHEFGGSEMRVFIYTSSERYEVLGEVDKNKVLVRTSDGSEKEIERDTYTKSRKRFRKEERKS